MLADEPFEGQHWEGATGLPEGGTVEGWESPSFDRYTGSYAASEDEDEYDESSVEETPLETASESSPRRANNLRDTTSLGRHSQTARDDAEHFGNRQYWKDGWRTDADTTRPFHFGDASTLGRRWIVLAMFRFDVSEFSVSQDRA